MTFSERMDVLKDDIARAREWIALIAIREELIDQDARIATLEVTANERDHNSGRD